MENQTDNSSKTDKPWLWKKGFCPNPGGRPAGKSMKAYAKEYLSKLTDEEKDEWLDGIDKETIFKMAEGNPKNDVEVTGKLTISQVLDELEENDRSTAQGQIMESEQPLQDPQ